MKEKTIIIPIRTQFKWHPATESPGTKPIVIAYKVKGHENEHYCFMSCQFREDGVTPATVAFQDNGVKKLAVAWAYTDEISVGITDEMFRSAEREGWAHWEQ